MGLKSQIGWILYGAQRTDARFAAYVAELRALQTRTQALEGAVAKLDTVVTRLDSEGATTMTAMQEQLRTITDDLGDRVGALSQRLESQLGA